MVGHEGIGVNVAAPIGSRFFQPVGAEVIILLGKKTGLPIDSAQNDVLRHSG
jgi:NAD(P)H-flavin reductase